MVAEISVPREAVVRDRQEFHGFIGCILGLVHGPSWYEHCISRSNINREVTNQYTPSAFDNSKQRFMCMAMMLGIAMRCNIHHTYVKYLSPKINTFNRKFNIEMFHSVRIQS